MLGVTTGTLAILVTQPILIYMLGVTTGILAILVTQPTLIYIYVRSNYWYPGYSGCPTY